MTLRLSERYVMALNLLLIAILAYFLALSVNDIVLGRVAEGTTASVQSLLGAMPSGPAARSRVYYNAITRRDIFNLTPVVEAPPPAEVATNLHIRLLGTSLVTLSQPFIIVEDDNDHEQALYRLGDEIPDAGKLVGVQKDYAVILHQGRRTKLEMPTDQNGVPSAPIYPPRPFGLQRRGFGGFLRGRAGLRSGMNGVRQIDPNSDVLDRTTLNNNLSNMAELFTQVRAIPNLGVDG